MALDFNSAGTARRVDHGSGSTLDDLPSGAFTAFGWFRRSATGANQFMMTKFSSGSAYWAMQAENTGGEGRINFAVGRATTNTAFNTNETTLAADTWTFVAATFDDAASPKVHIYYGTEGSTLAECTYQTTTPGTGAIGSDASGNLLVGNLDTGAPANPFLGQIAVTGVIGSVLTLAQLQPLQHDVWSAKAYDCRMLTEYFDTGTAPDYSGNANTGTVTSATEYAHPPLPSPWVFPQEDTAFDFVPATQDIGVTSSAWQFSPYNTYSDGAGALATTNVKASSTYALWSTPGAYFKTKVVVAVGGAGACKLLLDTTSLQTLTANKCPYISVSVDDGAFTNTQIAYSASTVAQDLGTLSANATHTIEVHFRGIGLNTPGDRWSTPLQAVKITGLRIDSTASLSAPTIRANRMLIFGDSMPEGAGAIGTADVEAVDNDAIQSFPNLLARGMAAEYGMVAYGGSGYVRGINNEAAAAGTPAIFNATDANQYYNKYHSGASRLVTGAFSPVPDYVIISAGSNDVSGGLTAQQVADAIDAIRTAAGASAWIFCLSGPNALSPSSTITSGVALATQQSRTKKITGTTLYTAGTASKYAADAGAGGNHANVRGHAHFAAEVLAAMQDEIQSGGGGLLTHPGMSGGIRG